MKYLHLNCVFTHFYLVFLLGSPCVLANEGLWI